AAWPSREGEFADKFNSMPKYVVSSKLKDPDWNNSTVLEGDVVEAVSKLKEQQDGEIQVAGSNQLVQTLLEHDLVDELRLMVFPVVLGAGKRLFGETRTGTAPALGPSRRFCGGLPARDGGWRGKARQRTAIAPVASAVRHATRAPIERPPATSGRPASSSARRRSTTAIQAASSCGGRAGERRPATR